MSEESAGAPKDQRDAAEREWLRRSNATTWAWFAVIVGALLMVGSLLPSFLNGQGGRGGIVLNDAEVIPVFGAVILVLGLLVIIQEWSGLT